MALRNILYVLVVVLLGSSPCFSQESRATILGRVVDQTNAVIVGATVQATNLDTNTVATSVTNQSGAFEIPYLLPGTYRITVELTGFKKAVRDKVELRVGDRIALDFTLEVGELTESVEVTGEPPLLETTNASVSAVMSQRLAQELPIVGGNTYYLVRSLPGIMPTGGHTAGNPQQQGMATNVVVDGTKNVSEVKMDGSPNVAQRVAVFGPPQDLVQEMKVHTASYDASLGHSAGAVTDVSTKSGTNKLHGTGYEYESRWRAVPWFTNRYIYDPTTGPITQEKKDSVISQWRHRRWGATFTGPVVLPHYDGRDKTFWSFGYEGVYINRQASQMRTVPTPAEKQGDFSHLLTVGSIYQIYDPLTTVPAQKKGRFQRAPLPGNVIPASRLSPIALNILGYYPDPNQPGTIDGRNNFLRAQDQEKHVRSLMHRIDHVISDKQRFFVRWNNLQYDQTNDTLPTKATEKSLDRTGWGVVLDDVYIFNPQLLLNLRYGLTYQNPYNYRGTQGFDLTTLGFPQTLVEMISAKTDPAGFTFPRATIDGGAFTELGYNGGSNVKVYYHNFGATLTKITGNHSLRFGSEFRLMRENGYSYGYVSPRFIFNQTYTRGPLDNSPTAPIGQGLASMLFGIPTGGSVNINASRAEQSTYWAGFVQDDWRLTPRLTVSLGLRYEYEGPTTERFNRSIRGFDFTTENPIADQAKANYAKNPIPEVPVENFEVRGGLLFAGDRGQPRTLWNRDRNNLAPRVGMAYKLTARTVIRAGYGIFFVPVGIDYQDVKLGGFNQPTSIVASVDNGQTYQASIGNPFPNGIKSPTGASAGLATYLGQSPSFFFERKVNPYMQRWSFAVQRQLPGRIVFETAYVGNRGTKLGVTRQFNPVPREYLSTLPYRDQETIDYLSAKVASPFYGIPQFVNTGRGNKKINRSALLQPYPHFGGITASLNNGYSWYHSLQTHVEKRMSSGLTFQGSWTWSKWMVANSYLNDTDARPEEVVSPNDYTHRFVVSALYELPFGQGKFLFSNAKGVLQGLIGGWQVQAMYEGQSGAPLGFGNRIFHGDLKDIVLPKSERTAERWFNTEAGFERDKKKQLASNIRTFPSRFSGIRGDGINNWDVSLFKDFRIKERYKLRFMILTFNTLNHVQFDAPNTNPTSSAFGSVTAEKGHGQRQVTLAAKLTF